MFNSSLRRIGLAMGLLIAICCWGLGGGFAAYAQMTTADILGTVSDSTGAILPGAQVTVHNEGTGEVRTMKANSAGDFVFSALQIGNYTITVASKSFKTFKAPGVAIAAGDRVRIDARLEPGAASETVVVESITPALQTDSSTVGDMLGTQSVQDLPLNGRNYVNLVQVTAGVNAAQPNSMQSGNRNGDRRLTGAYSANGQSEVFNNNMVDGLDNNERTAGYSVVRPSVDAIDEIKILTSNYSAELGRAAGAVVNVVTKSGSNAFHGTAYEFLRNEMFDANDYFYRTGHKPEYRQNQYGGSVGGPIIRDKTFFFVDVQESQNVKSGTSILTTPTLYEEQNPGDFTDIGKGKVSAASMNSIGLAYFKLYPAPTTTALVNNYQGTYRQTQKSTTVDAKVDHHFSANDIFFARYAYNPTTTFTPSAFPDVTLTGVAKPISPGGVVTAVTGNSDTTTQNLQLDYTHIFTPSLLAQLKAGYTRYDTQTTALNYGNNVAQQLGMTGVNLPNVPGTSGMPLFYPIGYSALGDAIYLPVANINNVYQLNGAVTYTRNTHTFKFGGAAIKREASIFQSTEAVGGYAFMGSPFGISNNLKAMLQGVALTLNRGNQLSGEILQFWEPSFYAQDDWHALQNLTLNLGVRYEVFTPEAEKRNRISNYNMTTMNMDVASSSDPHFGLKTEYANISPRVGFSYSLPHETVLRGGFGMSFYPSDVGAAAQEQNVPFDTAYAKVGYISISSAMPVPTAIPASSFMSNSSITTVTSKAENFRTSYMEQFNLALQKQYGANVITIGYVGELGRRLVFNSNADLPAPPGAGNPTPAYLYAKQLPYITNINYFNNGATASYNAMQLQFQRRFTKGLTVNANYTLAHGLNNTFSMSGANGSFGETTSMVPSNPRYDYGNSDLDVRHRYAASIAYEIPYGKNFTGVKGAAVKDWQINTVGYWQTGLPFTVMDATTPVAGGLAAVNLPGQTGDRPNQIRSAKLSNPSINKFFDTSAFQQQTIGTLGSEGRNQTYGPHDRRLDVSLFKNFPIYEKLKGQFRVECFNILNIANFAGPNTSIADSTPTPAGGVYDPLNFTGGYGTITSTASSETARQMQFAMKLSF